MAHRDDRSFEFVLNECENGKMVQKVFSAEAVKQKLKMLKKLLPVEVFEWPAHTPADEVAAMYPIYKLLANAAGRQQARMRRKPGTSPVLTACVPSLCCTGGELQRLRHVRVGGSAPTPN